MTRPADLSPNPDHPPADPAGQPAPPPGAPGGGRAALTRLVRALAGAPRAVADLLTPPSCAVCADSEAELTDGWCSACLARLLTLTALAYCPRCGTTLGENVPPRPDGCGHCPTVLGRFDRVVRLGPYAPPLRTAVHRLKYHRAMHLADRLGRLLAGAIRGQIHPAEIDAVCHVPMHWRRRAWRGCDHAAVLARALARHLSLPAADLLVRTRLTRQQVRLSRAARQANVRRSLRVVDPDGTAGARLILVDDVTTTGATGNEAAAMLKSAGARRVVLAVVAKSELTSIYLAHLRRLTGESDTPSAPQP